MRKITLFTILCISVITGKAQVTTLHDNFDVDCVTGSPVPLHWLCTNTLPTIDPLGAWHCNATCGNLGTPGLECTGNFGGSFHLDSSFLVTPLLNLSSYTGHVYLHFDSKTDSIVFGGKLTIERTIDSPFVADSPYVDLTPGLTPVISSLDSSGWVTHQADLTSYAGAGKPPFYIAFRYVSNTASGSVWHLDNVNITTTSLFVSKIIKENSQLGIVSSTSSQIVFNYITETAGTCPLAIYDMVGRKVYAGALNIQAGTANYTLSDLNLHPGMYIMKLENESNYFTTKMMIE